MQQMMCTPKINRGTEHTLVPTKTKQKHMIELLRVVSIRGRRITSSLDMKHIPATENKNGSSNDASE